MDSFGHTPFLTGKVAIVTGAAQGNGFAIAERLARHGCSVAAIDINADGIRTATTRLGERAKPFVADCANVASIRGVVRQVHDALGRIDVLVNNAGILRVASFPDIGEADFDATINLNLKGAFFFAQEVQAHLPRDGRIINIASVAGVDGRTLSAPYAATKAGLITMTKTLARALAPRGITVNAVAPGPVETELFLQGKTEQQVQAIAGMNPFKRLGKPDDIAQVVAFLAGTTSGWVSGQVIRANGGVI